MKPDIDKFPCLYLAIEAIKTGGTAPAVLNEGNEELVSMFLSDKIKFFEIEDEREIESEPDEIDSPMLQEAFTELWERSPCKQYRGEARKAFLALFPVGISQRETERRLRTVRRIIFYRRYE